MLRAFDPFVFEIERHLRRAIALIGNDEKLLLVLRFEVSADFFDGARSGLPAADVISRIAMMRKPQIQTAEQIGVHNEEGAGDRKHDRRAKKWRGGATGREPLGPIRRGQYCETDDGERVPVRCGLVVDREQKIKCEDRYPEPEKIKDFELLPRPAPVPDHRPSHREKKQRREGQKMPEKKTEQLERM